jgi:wingless-type MMTV integration site family protein 8
MIKICKCHGVSGSCSLQTCWMRINDFQEVGNYLKRSYRKAIKIDSNDNNPLRDNDVLRKSTLSLPKSRLVYSEDSPNYCIANTTLGSNGTLGRYCSQRKSKDVTIEEKRSCRKLCRQCGLKVKRERRRILTSCNCKFKFCCEVECQSCAKEQYNFVCSDKD